MNYPLKSRKNKPSIEINWNVREIFSESALECFLREIDDIYLSIEKKTD
tara:strand:+ start:447 stop:593 length:147 start_codon:yes stop_codon:yes gene_type:complete